MSAKVCKEVVIVMLGAEYPAGTRLIKKKTLVAADPKDTATCGLTTDTRTGNWAVEALMSVV